MCGVTGEISQRKRRRRAKNTELKHLFSKNYLNSPGGFKVRPGFALFIPAQRPRIGTSRIAFYVQRARLSKNMSLKTLLSQEHFVTFVNSPPQLPNVNTENMLQIAQKGRERMLSGNIL